MIKKIYIYLVIMFILFFSFNLKINAQSYIIKDYNETDLDSYCSASGQINFSCGGVKRIENCTAIEIKIGNSETASDEFYIRTYIFVYEIGFFEFGHISSVYAGKGFNFPNVSYKRNVYWEYYRDYEKIILLDARKGLSTNLTDSEINMYKDSLDEAANAAFEEYLNSSNDNIINNIKVKANDSNEYNTNINTNLVEVSGEWEKIFEEQNGGMKEGELYGISQKYMYNFCDGYINLSGSNFSDVEYKCGEVLLGENYSEGYSKYYVPLLYPSNVPFNFNIVSINSEGYLNVNGTCKINVVNELFDCNRSGCDPRYYYRPISLVEPFPDGEISSNWKGYDNETFRNRLENTYDNGFYYKVVLVESNPKSGELAIDSIEDSNYNDWTNMNKNGTSNFLNDSYFRKNNVYSYCEVGSFDINCDAYKIGSDDS